MESWHQKEYVSSDLVCDEELLARNRNLFVGWEMKVPEFGADTLMSEKGSDNVIEEVGYSEISEKPFLATSTSTRDYCFNKGCIREMVTPIQGFPKTSSVDDEFYSKFSSPFSESDCQNSAHTNLKLGRLADSRVSKSFKLFRGSSIVSSAESSTPVKRTRSAGLNSQTFFCQVHGCSKDLSSSKDYHKKHKVCDSHSKTAKVIVNGVEQRFCQQCSRFHLLTEFDEGKRSCRRRLACHNERRRKPHLGNHYGRSGKFQSYNGGRLNEISFSKTSSICEEIFVSDQLHLEKHGANGWNQHTRVKFENDYSNLFAVPEENGNLHPKNHLQAINLGKESSVCGSQADNLLKSVIRDTGDDYSHGLPRLQCSDRSYSFTSFGYQDSNVFCTKPNFNGFSTITSPGVLSLLSSQSQNSSSYSTGIPTAQTSSITGNPAYCIVSQVSDTILEAFPIASVNGVSHKLPSCGLSSEMSNLHPILNPEDNIGVNFGNSELFEGLTDDTGGLSCEDELTLDLLQLSSQLQRVEHQKQSMYAMPHH